MLRRARRIYGRNPEPTPPKQISAFETQVLEQMEITEQAERI